VADTPESGAIVKREDETPERDPIVSRSTSGWMLITTLLLIGTLAWALYDEAYGQRPWKGAQQEFVARYARYLKSIRSNAGKSEAEVKESAEYQTLAEKAKAAEESVADEFKENTQKIKIIDDQLAAVTDPFQNARGQITVVNYQIETAKESKKDSLRQKVARMKDEKSTIYLPADDGSGKTTKQELNYTNLEALYNKLKDDKAKLLDANAKLLKEPTELRKKRDEYLRNHIIGLTPGQIDSIVSKYEKGFDYTIKQVNASGGEVIDRCETCHLGVREPLTIKAYDLAPDGPGKKSHG